jgi:diaminohydroxyphosphoribosylaminopyrimidine deaminase/5-amino-6-(5-phosphoribosylamino)uracil reductase
VEVLPVAAARGVVAMPALLRVLARRGVTSVLVEGGATVAAAMLRARQVDRVAWFVAPAMLGDDAVAAIAGLGVDRVRRAIRLVDVETERLGADVLVSGSIASRSGRPPFASTWPPR